MKLVTCLMATLVASPAFAHHEIEAASASPALLIALGLAFASVPAYVVFAPKVARLKVRLG